MKVICSSTGPKRKTAFFYYEMRVSAGLKFKLRDAVRWTSSAGYAFDRYYYEGTTFSLTGGMDRVDVGAGPFVAAQLQVRFDQYGVQGTEAESGAFRGASGGGAPCICGCVQRVTYCLLTINGPHKLIWP